MFPYLYFPTYQLGPFSVQIFGLLVAFSVVLGTHLARNQAEKMGQDVNLVIDSFFWILPIAFFISHLVSVVGYFPEKIAKDPMILLYVWAGISSFGGILGGGLVAAIFFRVKKVPVLSYLESIAFGFVPAFMVGRFGCTVAHDHPGLWVVSDAKTPWVLGSFQQNLANGKLSLYQFELPIQNSISLVLTILVCSWLLGLIVSRWKEISMFSTVVLSTMFVFGVSFYLLYPWVPSFLRSLAVSWPTQWSEIPLTSFHWIDRQSAFSVRARFDLGLMEAILYIAFSVVVFVSAQKNRFVGFRVGIWFVMYAPCRFFMDYLRTADKRYFGLTPGQFLSILTLLIGVTLLLQEKNEKWDDAGKKRKEELEKSDSLIQTES